MLVVVVRKSMRSPWSVGRYVPYLASSYLGTYIYIYTYIHIFNTRRFVRLRERKTERHRYIRRKRKDGM